MVSSILIVLLVLVAALVGYASTKPNTFRYARSRVIKASPSKVFDQVNDFRNWNTWSPWARMDPNAKTVFEGPAAGTGAKMSWEGNHKVGSGGMVITDSLNPDFIAIRLDFKAPMKGTSNAEFRFKPVSEGTRMEWSMVGESNLMGKIMSLVMNCEKMVGAQYDQGMSNIAEIVEGK